MRKLKGTVMKATRDYMDACLRDDAGNSKIASIYVPREVISRGPRLRRLAGSSWVWRNEFKHKVDEIRSMPAAEKRIDGRVDVVKGRVGTSAVRADAANRGRPPA